MPAILDHLFACVLILGVPLYAALYSRPRLRRHVASGEPAARVRTYWVNIVYQWLLAAAALSIWRLEHRPIGELGLGLEVSWRFWTAAGLVALGLAGLTLNYRAALRSEKDRRRLREQLGDAAALTPRNEREMAHFAALSLTAGVCEEILYRGYLIWYLGTLVGTGFLGTSLSVVTAAVAFGASHLYQGPSQAARIFGLAIIAGGLYVLSGSLWVLMVLHVGVDVAGGLVSLALYRAPCAPEAPHMMDASCTSPRSTGLT